MSQITQTLNWRYGVRHSRMMCMIWSPAPEHQETQRAKLAYAQALSKPIRLLCLGATRLPEDVCAGYADVQSARIRTKEDAARQISAWLVALEE